MKKEKEWIKREKKLLEDSMRRVTEDERKEKKRLKEEREEKEKEENLKEIIMFNLELSELEMEFERDLEAVLSEWENLIEECREIKENDEEEVELCKEVKSQVPSEEEAEVCKEACSQVSSEEDAEMCKNESSQVKSEVKAKVEVVVSLQVMKVNQLNKSLRSVSKMRKMNVLKIVKMNHVKRSWKTHFKKSLVNKSCVLMKSQQTNQILNLLC